MSPCRPYSDVGEAMQRVNGLIQEAEFDVRTADIGEHLNPGDVYDAYVDIGRTPVLEHKLTPNACGPFAAVYLQRNPTNPESAWEEYVKQTFHPQYVEGFLNGFQLCLPEQASGYTAHFLRGVYDGVVANAAVF